MQSWIFYIFLIFGKHVNTHILYFDRLIKFQVGNYPPQLERKPLRRGIKERIGVIKTVDDM